MGTAIFFLFSIFVFDLVLGLGYGLSFKYFYFDTVLHFLGGFFVAMFFTSYFKNLNPGNPGSPKIKRAFVIISAALFVGVFWEFLEYLGTRLLGDYLYSNYQIICCIGDLEDTIGDLAMDILGALTFSAAFLSPSRPKTPSR